MLMFNVSYVSAHKMLKKDDFFKASIIKIIKDNVSKKMAKGNIRRWSYSVGFKTFSENSEFTAIYEYFKVHIANILAAKGENL